MKHCNILLFIVLAFTAGAQKVRPDAFPPVIDTLAPKVTLASTIEEMHSWDRYPTYPVYVAMMQQYADSFPALCHLDTIGTSVQGRLLLSLVITGPSPAKAARPEFFYSSTMHGDEVTGFYLMLRLCDTLLRSYGTSPAITRLLDNVCIYINPNANPDGTYHSGDNTMSGAQRYNANDVDLNRNYPDPFGVAAMDPLQPENEQMIDYVDGHHFLMGANLHGGSEVLNYPWDSRTSREQLNEHDAWWQQVCKRFIDTVRSIDSQRYRDVAYRNGYIVGGDWYVISNGRQDYFNYYNGIREMTLEVSGTKMLPNSQLNHYWQANAQALINYIAEVEALDTTHTGIVIPQPAPTLTAYPNPTRGPVTVDGPTGSYHFDLSGRPAGVYLLPVEGGAVKVVKL